MKLPDGPKNHTWLQNLQWIVDPVSYMKSTTKRYGDIFTAPLGLNSAPLVFVSNPQAIKQILSNDSKQFASPSGGDGTLAPVLGDSSVFMLEGKEHRQRRKVLMPPFHNQSIQIYGDLICQIAEQVFNQLEIGKPFSTRKVMENISLQAIVKIVFGIYRGERYQQLMTKLLSLLSIFQSPLKFSLFTLPVLQVNFGFWSPWGYFLNLKQQIDELVYAEIRERRCNFDSERTDLLSLLISAHDGNGKSMTDKELRDELIALMVAGYDTTASSLTWAFCWIHYLPEVREKLLEEIDSFSDLQDRMTIAKLPYLSAVCNEALRSGGVIQALSREVKEPVNLMGYQLEPGTMLSPCIYLLHRREELYPEPEQFRPERFLERNFSPYEFMPFGGGSRYCIGSALAPFEIKLVLATVLSHYQLKLVTKRQIKSERRAVTLVPAGDIKMMITN